MVCDMEGEISMNIGGVGSISAIDSSYRFAGAERANNSDVVAIERRIEALEQSMNDAEGNDKLTAEERKKRVEQYQQQIQQLQMQKQQLIQAHEKEARERQQAELQAQMEEQQQSAPKDEEHPEREAQKISDDAMNAMTGISTAMDMHSSMSALRTKMIGEARVTGAEAKLDAARGMDTSVKDAQVADLNENVNKLTEKIIGNLSDTASDLQEANQANQADAEKRAEDRKDGNSSISDEEKASEGVSIRIEDESKTESDGIETAESKATGIKIEKEESKEDRKLQERIQITEDGKKKEATLPEGYYPVDVYR